MNFLMRSIRSAPGLAALMGILAAAEPSATAGQSSSEASAPRVPPASPGPIVTDRPDRTESAESVPAGFVQVEAGWTFARDQAAGATQESHALPEALVRVGLGGGIEARFGFSGFMFEERSGAGENTRSDGAGDAELGLKLEVARGSGGQVALLAGASLPTGHDDFSSQRVDPSFLVLVAHPLSERLSLGYNLGFAAATGPAGSGADGRLDTRWEAPYTLALGIGLGGRVGAFVESFGAFGLEGQDAVHGLDGGFTFLVSEAFQLDVSGGVGLSEAGDDWFIGGGLSARLPG